MSKTVAYLSRSALHTQHTLWKTYLPWIKPFYAVKCNNLQPLMSWMYNDFKREIGFDCASQREIEEVNELGATSEDILYAQPCKSPKSIDFCKNQRMYRTVVDCPEEVEKLGLQEWKGEVLIRLAVPDSESRQPFSSKFGARLNELFEIVKVLKKYSIQCVGFSFHVGSECMNPFQFYQALEMCLASKKIMDLFGVSIRVLDIGGGFLSDAESFKKIAKAIHMGRKDFFPNSNIEWIAEPGRFYAQPTVSLEIPILGAKKGRDVDRVYTLDESIYGMFSCIPFDHQKPEFQTSVTGSLVSSRIFGRTCDSADVLAKHVLLPRLNVGDFVTVKNMGAYTFVSSCEFNGFPKPELILLE